MAEADGYSFAQINKRALLAFTPTTLMVVNYTGTSQLEKVKEGIPALLKQTGENSINSNTAFKKMQKQDGDIKETTIQSLKGAMREGDYGLFVTLSNYTKMLRNTWITPRLFAVLTAQNLWIWS